MNTKTVRIQIPISYGKVEVWSVPRGFAKEYIRRARIPCSAAVWCDMMSLVGYTLSEDTYNRITLQQRIEAEIFASREHLSASDNPVQRHPRPLWLPASLQHAS